MDDELKKKLTKEPINMVKSLNQQFDPNCEKMKSFIHNNFKDCDLIDYDRELVMHERQTRQLTEMELQEELVKESQRVWQFITTKVIVNDSKEQNRHQTVIK